MPIAVVGIDCRFPGAPDKDAFWRLLMDGVVTDTEVPSQRWDIDTYYHPDGVAGSMNTRRAHFIDEVDAFDNDFFGIAPIEADGSAAALVPAGIPVRMQAIDRFGMALTSEPVWVSGAAGESRIQPAPGSRELAERVDVVEVVGAAGAIVADREQAEEPRALLGLGGAEQREDQVGVELRGYGDRRLQRGAALGVEIAAHLAAQHLEIGVV